MYHFISGYTALVTLILKMFEILLFLRTDEQYSFSAAVFILCSYFLFLDFPKLQVAGTEDGIKEPQATFSACFGAAFIMFHPTKYAAMLAAKMQKHGATGWLVNTGWSGGR